MAPRTIIVSNRLPITVAVQNGEIEVTRSAGGLATGMKGAHEGSEGLWVGWPGQVSGIDDERRAKLDRQLDQMRLVPVLLSDEEVNRFYGVFSNGTLWPLFHYVLSDSTASAEDFEVYERVNDRFAEAVARLYRPGDTIWVHDYQLMRVPALLRARLPHARIGFFLHIPFPSSEVFRTLPFREELLEGMLGADLIGFHTASYLRHFASSLLQILGASSDLDRVSWLGRVVKLGVFPMGVDATEFAKLGSNPEIIARATELRGDKAGLFVAVDRLDYTKGIPQRLRAFERFLRLHPEFHRKVKLVQVAVPSRTGVEAYAELLDQVDSLVGHINGVFGTPNWVPVHHMFRGFPPEEIAALYRAADVLLVTPTRDGMNLVAKEFVATREDEDGVLLLSEFAGAASELAGAIIVNPHDVERTASAMHRALTMPQEERQTRMQALRRRVQSFTVQHWAEAFLAALERTKPEVDGGGTVRSSEAELSAAIEQLAAAPSRVLFLDYDGTLVSFTEVPELAVPDQELRDLLNGLVALPRMQVHIVTGRPREVIQRWLGHLPLGLHAEHGQWSWVSGVQEWRALSHPDLSWRPAVLEILKEFATRTPGALIEEKSVSIAWHYRKADPRFGSFQARELRMHLNALLSNVPVEVLSGNKVIEVRPHGVHKGRVVAPVLAAAPVGAAALAIGDDTTDENLFAALPPGGLSVHVGPMASQARLRLDSVADARALLRRLR